MKKRKNGERKIKLDFGSTLALVFIILYCLIIVFMLYFIIITSLKSVYDFSLDENIFGFPNWAKYPFNFDNFGKAFEGMEIQIKGSNYASVPQQFLYAIMYSLGSAVASAFAKAMPAYFCAKYKTFLGKTLYLVVVITMILPITGTMAATITIMRSLNIYDTYLGNLYFNAGFYGMYFLVFYAAFKSISETYSEAAKIDGAGHFAILFKINLPMVMPTLIAVIIMLFIGFWNDYQTPMIYLPSKPTIAYGLFVFSKKPSADNAPALLSACFLVCIPIVILFSIFKNKIMGNISAGGIKG